MSRPRGRKHAVFIRMHATHDDVTLRPGKARQPPISSSPSPSCCRSLLHSSSASTLARSLGCLEGLGKAGDLGSFVWGFFAGTSGAPKRHGSALSRRRRRACGRFAGGDGWPRVEHAAGERIKAVHLGGIFPFPRVFDLVCMRLCSVLENKIWSRSGAWEERG